MLLVYIGLVSTEMTRNGSFLLRSFIFPQNWKRNTRSGQTNHFEYAQVKKYFPTVFDSRHKEKPTRCGHSHAWMQTPEMQGHKFIVVDGFRKRFCWTKVSRVGFSQLFKISHNIFQSFVLEPI